MDKLAICLLLSFNLCSGFVLEPAESGGSLKLPTEYHFRCDVTTLENTQKFEIWYSANESRSRKDSNGGLVRRYCSDNGWQYMVHPKSTIDLESEIVCTKTEDVELTDFLPSESFISAGRVTLNGRLVEVWNSSELSEGGLRSVATLYVYRDGDVDVPVLYQERTDNLQTGVISSYTVTRYYDFEKPKPEDLVYESEDYCDYGFLQAHDASHVEEAFRRYKKHHNKVYDEDEEETRKSIFEKNLRLITEHNKKNLSYKMGLNKFSDRRRSELKHLTGTRPAPRSWRLPPPEPLPLTAQQLEQLVEDLPRNYDMRTEGFITLVKNQGECGSCWAFSTTAAVEGAMAKNNGGRTLDLSEQSLVDCAWGYHNEGCDGGLMFGTFQYVLKNGIPTEREYGLYSGDDGVCQLNNMTQVYTIKSFAAIPALSVNATRAALYHFGPVVVTINARSTLQSYSSGIYYDKKCNKKPANHAVTLVGYGELDGAPYWIVKNSWGADWGEDGYVLFSAQENNCHILEEPFCPIV